LPLQKCPQRTGVPPDYSGRAYLNFVVLGDQGTNSNIQRHVSWAMFRECAKRGVMIQNLNPKATPRFDNAVWNDPSAMSQRPPTDEEKDFAAAGCDFFVTTGDNIYPNGPNEGIFPIDKPNSQFATHFWGQYSYFRNPFFMSMGNHDYGTYIGSEFLNHRPFARSPIQELRYGAYCRKLYWMGQDVVPVNPDDLVTNANGEIDLVRVYQVPRLPPWIDLWAIDTNFYDGQSGRTAKQYLDYQIAYMNGHKKVEGVNQAPKFMMTFGHHPIISHGSHGSKCGIGVNPNRKRNTAPAELNHATGMINIANIFKAQVGVNVFISGHDHHMEHNSMFTTNVGGGGKIFQYDNFLLGNGGKHPSPSKKVGKYDLTCQKARGTPPHGQPAFEYRWDFFPTSTGIVVQTNAVSDNGKDPAEFWKPANIKTKTYPGFGLFSLYGDGRLVARYYRVVIEEDALSDHISKYRLQYVYERHYVGAPSLIPSPYANVDTNTWPFYPETPLNALPEKSDKDTAREAKARRDLRLLPLLEAFLGEDLDPEGEDDD